MDFWGGGVGEGTPTKLANGWIIMFILTVPFLLMVLIFSLCCCRYHYFDYFRPISTWKAERRARRREEMENNGFMVGDVRRQQSVVEIDEEEGESLGQRMRRLRDLEMGSDGRYSPTVHLPLGCRSLRTPSTRSSMFGHYPSMVPEIPFSTMASVNGMVAGSSYCPSVASTSYRPVSQLGSIYSPDTRDLFRLASSSGPIHGTLLAAPSHSFCAQNSQENAQAFARYPTSNSARDIGPPSVASFHRMSYSSRDNLCSVSRSDSTNGWSVAPSSLSPNLRQTQGRRTSLLSMQELPSANRESLETVLERSASMNELAGDSASIDKQVRPQSESVDGTLRETNELPLSASKLASETEGAVDPSTLPAIVLPQDGREF
ncbi:Kinesin-like protein 6 [Venturia nashicola]|uniref:Kinesin-like protein 6 n=1 Tax=Venturia nashicola TaxID=86259 RepID=A0A4Z1NWU6_9PEZI|nr:Kinesin-like protein 6 [Venturia nashicola]TLD30095.1 Kinesin-like protein 6 [Venturia nashicola]